MVGSPAPEVRVSKALGVEVLGMVQQEADMLAGEVYQKTFEHSGCAEEGSEAAAVVDYTSVVVAAAAAVVVVPDNAKPCHHGQLDQSGREKCQLKPKM